MSLPYQYKVETFIEEGRTTRGAIDNIKNWLKTTTLPQLQEEFIFLFLVSCKNDVEASKKTIEAYFRVKHKAPEIFSDLDPFNKNLKKVMHVVDFCIIPVRMEDNTLIITTKLNDTKYWNIEFAPLAKTAAMLLHLCQIDNPPNKIIIVIDLAGVNFMHLTRIRFGIMCSFLEYIQESLPLRIRRIHILNGNYVYDKVISLFNLFIKSELLKSMISHAPGMNLKHFHDEYIPARYLPEEYGGELPSIKELNKRTCEDFDNARPFFLEEERLRSCYRG